MPLPDRVKVVIVTVKVVVVVVAVKVKALILILPEVAKVVNPRSLAVLPQVNTRRIITFRLIIIIM